MKSLITPIITPIANGYAVAGLTTIQAEPHRSLTEALELAERIACNPFDYLKACRDFQVPGVTDDRQPPPDPAAGVDDEALLIGFT